MSQAARPAKLALIAAMAKNRVIGRDNTLPWRLSDDLKRFKALTLGHPIIMGRKTWDSLGRPLPGRENIVISRQTDLRIEGAQVFSSLEAVLAHCAAQPIAFIIGGGQLYTQSLPLADTLYLTEVDTQVDGDAYFPEFDATQFHETACERHAADEKNEHNYSFIELNRK